MKGTRQNTGKYALYAREVAGIVSALREVGEMLVRTRPSVRWGTALVVIGVVGAACSLNPQPLPPDTEPSGSVQVDGGTPTSGDASFETDGSTAQNGDASDAVDGAGSIPGDGQATPPTDADADAGDANTDGGLDDASDAALDGGAGDALGEGD